MALLIADALIPVFFVMFLGYLAGARRIIDNQHVASLNALVMTFALPQGYPMAPPPPLAPARRH